MGTKKTQNRANEKRKMAQIPLTSLENEATWKYNSFELSLRFIPIYKSLQ